jgi:MFS transporter, putative metabolite:H+ symporter
MWLLGFVFFFELGDINSFSFAAPAIRIGWHLSIATIGFITSATFVGVANHDAEHQQLARW